ENTFWSKSHEWSITPMHKATAQLIIFFVFISSWYFSLEINVNTQYDCKRNGERCAVDFHFRVQTLVIGQHQRILQIHEYGSIRSNLVSLQELLRQHISQLDILETP